MSLSDIDRNTLHQVARDSIEYTLQNGRNVQFEKTLDIQEYPPELQQHRATFVTLRIDRELRGCIGTLQAYQPLVFDVSHNARSAAFQDPRFSPLTIQEFPLVDVHISILGLPELMNFSSEQDLIAQIRPGIDGLILTAGSHRGTFLPSVWESLNSAQEFWSHLKLKAGLPANYWSDDIKVERYTTESF